MKPTFSTESAESSYPRKAALGQELRLYERPFSTYSFRCRDAHSGSSRLSKQIQLFDLEAYQVILEGEWNLTAQQRHLLGGRKLPSSMQLPWPHAIINIKLTSERLE